MLLDRPGLNVIQERMPPRTTEVRHEHERTLQLYFVLEGEAMVEVGETSERLGVGDAVEIPFGTPHRIVNDADEPLEFLVISTGPPRADRRDLS